METSILTTADEVVGYVKRVNQIADEHRKEFGFMPSSFYEEMALREQLWVAVSRQERSRILGYLAFAASHSRIRIAQLYVDPSCRRYGIGRALLDRLKSHALARHIQVISARVASDLPANQFWNSQGFYVLRQEPGGKTTQRTINIRIHELESNSLFGSSVPSPALEWMQAAASDPVLRAPTYTLDLNVFFDVLHSRVDTDFAERLFAAAYGGDVRLCVSHEFTAELRRRSKDSALDPAMRFAESLPTLPTVESSRLEELTSELRSIVFPLRNPGRRSASNDESDLRHLAACIYHRRRGFITRERAILRAGPVLRERYRLEVLSPHDLVVPVDELPDQEIHTSLQLGDTDFHTEDYSESWSPHVVQLLNECDVQGHIVAELLDAGTSSKRRFRLLVFAGDTLIAYASWNDLATTETVQCCYLIVRERMAEAQLAIDHVLGVLLAALPENRFVRCQVWTSVQQLRTREAARELGFELPLESRVGLAGLEKVAYRGVVLAPDWSRFRTDFFSLTGTELQNCPPNFKEAISTGLLLNRPDRSLKKAVDLFSFETKLAPALLLLPRREAMLVPIREKFASELLPSIRMQKSLFSKEALVHIERAYFGRANVLSRLQRGMLVVFYVSGKEGGRAEAVGMARVTSSGVGSPIQLRMDLLRQGVLDLEVLEQLADDHGEIGYFTFDSFFKFPVGLSYEEINALGCVEGNNLVTIQRLDHRKLESMVELARAKESK